MPSDPEDWLGDWERRAQEQAELTTELSRQMQAAGASADSPGGELHLTVDHTGGLTGLRLTDRAMYLGPDELAALILNASREAQARIAREIADMARNLYGSDSATTAFIADAYTTRFPAAADDGDGGRR